MRFDIAYVIGILLFVLFCFVVSQSSRKEGVKSCASCCVSPAPVKGGPAKGKAGPDGSGPGDLPGSSPHKCGGGDDEELKWIKEEEKYFEKRRKQLEGKSSCDIKFPALDKFYTYNKSKPLGEQLVMDVMNDKEGFTLGDGSSVSRLHEQCSKLKNCKDIKNLSNDRGCGYCGATKKFLMGNSKGPIADHCPKGWTYSSQTCKKVRQKDVCKNLKSCLGLVSHGPTKICGWCPQKKKAFIARSHQGQLHPVHKEDSCNTPLLGPGKCMHVSGPCSGHNYNKGPHTVECLRKIWKDVGCSPASKMGYKLRDVNDARVRNWNKMSVPKMYKDMLKFKREADKGSREHQILCYGHTKEGFESGNVIGHSTKVAANKAKQALAVQKEKKKKGEKSGRISAGRDLSQYKCQEDELWDVGPNTGLYVDPRVRVCNRTKPGKSFHYPKPSL